MESIKFNYPPAMTALAKCYHYGHGVEVDLTKAFHYYTLGHLGNDAEASFYLGQFYENGTTVKKDINKAAEFYIAAANNNHALAMRILASFYDGSGNGVPHDAKKAFLLYQKAAELGDTKAMIKMAEYFRWDQFVKRDHKKAEEWLRRAIDLGDTDAMCQFASEKYSSLVLAKTSNESVYDIEDKCREAIILYELAITHGSEKAKKEIAKIYEELRTESVSGNNSHYKTMAKRLLTLRKTERD